MECPEKINILIVDDQPENLVSLEATLEALEANIVKANSGNEALGMILTYDFALVLLDVQMPGMDGFETAELMRGNSRARHLPIIFVTAISKEQRHIFRGYESGAVDYIFKPIDPDILRNKVSVFMDLHKQKKIIENKNIELKAVNRKILEQQKALVEEERLKALLQMAGATSHDLNHPLAELLGNIEMLEMAKDDHQKIFKYLPAIKNASMRISDAVKRIQYIRYDVTENHDNRLYKIQQDRRIDILAVDDSDLNLDMLFSLLDETNLSRAKSMGDAFSRLKESRFDIILLNYQLPDGTGLDFIRKLAAEGIETPVVVVTGKGAEQIETSALAAGAYDYINRARMDKNSLSRLISVTLEKYSLNKEIDLWVKKMAEMSTRDQLTGLRNRRSMQEVMEREFARSTRYRSDLSCLMIDLDFFKLVNDNFGHICGDFVLQEFSERLQKSKREPDFLFRYGGEEFMVLLPETDIEGAVRRAEVIRELCEFQTYAFEEYHLHITVSIGVSSINASQSDCAETLVSLADKALYRAKANGRNRVERC